MLFTMRETYVDRNPKMAQPVQNINHSAFRSMFEREKLSGNNFNDWFRQLKLVLRVEKKMFVIEQPCPPAHAADSATNVLAEWNATYDAYKELKSMFEKQARVERFDLIQTFHACKQEEGKPVSAYVLQMKRYVDQLERLGYVLPQDLTYEKGLPKKAETPQVMAIRSGKIQKANKKSLKAQEKGKTNDKGKDKQVYIPKPKNHKPTAKDDTCHHYTEGLRGARKMEQRALYLYMGNGVRAQVEAIGSFDLVLNNLLWGKEFKDYLKDCGIVNSLPSIHTTNTMECLKENCTLLDMVRSMMNLTTLSLSFWDYALESATRILNMVPTKKVDKTPYELWYGKVPNLSYLKVWGCEALVKRDTPDKLQQRSVKCIFIGYPKETMGYYFYFPPENKIVVARYAEFFEKSLITQEVSGRAIDLEEIQDEDTSPSEITSKIPMEVEGFEPPQEEVIPIRRSERTHQAPNRLCLNVEAEEHSLGDLNEPTS
ncbi:retrotransposon protein, putative, ty1-copia subclass [Tanacetum coccineum]